MYEVPKLIRFIRVVHTSHVHCFLPVYGRVDNSSVSCCCVTWAPSSVEYAARVKLVEFSTVRCRFPADGRIQYSRYLPYFILFDGIDFGLVVEPPLEAAGW